MLSLILTKEELFYLQKAAIIFDNAKSNQKGYTKDDAEFSRQLIVKLLSIEKGGNNGSNDG